MREAAAAAAEEDVNGNPPLKWHGCCIFFFKSFLYLFQKNRQANGYLLLDWSLLDFHLSFLMRTVVVSCFRGFTEEMTSDWAGPVGVVSAFSPCSKVSWIYRICCRPPTTH